MYTEEDLNFAVEKDIFSRDAVEKFRELISSTRNSPAADEENFKLIAGFNDIFVVIACSLLLFSSLWLFSKASESAGIFVFAALSWGLSEFFVLKRKMALPAIALLLSFIGGVFAFVNSLFAEPSELAVFLAAGLSATAAWFHWKRFRVPITVATGAAAVVATLMAALAGVFPEAENLLLMSLFICGGGVFLFAMYWDSADTSRTTRKSDIAFWLHLLAAPLVIHPVFLRLGVLGGDESLLSMAIVILLYLFMTFISLVVDRRAFMISSLVYVLYALSSLIENYGGVGYSFALTGVVMGAALLLLSAGWHRVRARLLPLLPESVLIYLPGAKIISRV